ncbi:hypothetical protein LTR46_004878 [Exophiala xenobiotica]|nr:hypothetical protein LTR46_004878 [Exophiala xenobiotica]
MQLVRRAHANSSFRYQYGSTEQHIRLLRALQTVSPNEEDDGATYPKSSGSTSQQIKGVVVVQGTLGSNSPSVPPSVPLNQAARLASALAEALDWPSEFGARLQQLGPHYRHLPCRLGHSKALDAAVHCVLTSYTLVSRGQQHMESLELASYGHAIKALREELSSSVDAAGQPSRGAGTTTTTTTSSETLCAALIIAQYELLKPGRTRFSYVTLAGGVSAIFQAGGPGRVVGSDFEIAIFSSQYPTIITQALLRGQECFLASPDWTNVMRRGDPSEDPIITDNWVAITQLPGLLRRIRSITTTTTANSDECIDTTSPLYPSILRDAYALRREIVKHNDSITRRLSHPGVYHVCPAVYKWPNPPSSSSTMQRPPEWTPTTKLETLLPKRIVKQCGMYHAWVITVNVVLSRLLLERPMPAVEGRNEDKTDKNGNAASALTLQTAQSAEYIMSTLDFVSSETKPFGGMYMTYAGPMAYGVLVLSRDRDRDSRPGGSGNGDMNMNKNKTRIWNERQDRQQLLLLDKLNDLFRPFGLRFDHDRMMTVFEAVTGGCAVRSRRGHVFTRRRSASDSGEGEGEGEGEGLTTESSSEPSPG